ncbi:MAG TPA: hypothetical protein VJW76_12515 [Verrucomicrobiae bacterium]|nr:hypothetical protein [Verrucomicrobiae bacterium]
MHAALDFRRLGPDQRRRELGVLIVEQVLSDYGRLSKLIPA